MENKLTHGSLFSGIGGFDLAAEWVGWENVFHCEWNKFGQKILKYYWPNSISYENICTTDFAIHRGKIDILTGGFPCQPYSTAGKRLGKADDRHLWPEMLRAIREIEPRWIVGENVRGLVSWNGGMVFEEVQADLEAEGYEVQPFLIPAASVGAPHRRDRIWFVAFNTKSKRDTKIGEVCQRKENESIGICKKNGNATNTESNGGQKYTRSVDGKSGKKEKRGDKFTIRSLHNGENGDASETNDGIIKNTNKNGWGSNEWKSESNEWEQRNTCTRNNEPISTNNGKVGNASDTTSNGRGKNNRIRNPKFFDKNGEIGNWEDFPTVSPICIRNDGISDRLDGITFSKWRNESIKAAGNAIVPQVAFQIFKAIQEYENKKQ